MADVIVPGNSLQATIKATTRNAQGQRVPATGITTLEVWYSDTAGGATIHADLILPAVEFGATGIYAVTHSGVLFTTHMGPRTSVWRVWSDGATIHATKQVSVQATRLLSQIPG
jgi:hypothetical protein